MVFNGCGHFGKQLGHACIKSTTHDLQRAFKWYLEKYVGFVNFFFFPDLEILSASIVYVSVEVLFIVQLVCSATVNSNELKMLSLAEGF